MAELRAQLVASHERQAIAKFIELFADKMPLSEIIQNIKDGSYISILFPPENLNA